MLSTSEGTSSSVEDNPIGKKSTIALISGSALVGGVLGNQLGPHAIEAGVALGVLTGTGVTLLIQKIVRRIDEFTESVIDTVAGE